MAQEYQFHEVWIFHNYVNNLQLPQGSVEALIYPKLTKANMQN